MQELYNRLPERSSRLYAGVEASKLGRGGISYIARELKLDLSSDCDRFQAGLIFSQRHRPSRADITNQTGIKKSVEGNAS
jgi:hypothetical protein